MTRFLRTSKTLAFALVLLLVLSACVAPPPAQPSPAESSAPAQPSPAESPAPSPAAAPVRIRMWSIATEADATHNAFVNAVSAYNAAHKDVQIDVTYIESESFKTQLQVAIGAGDPPDIFQDWGGGVLKSLVDAGVVREIKALSGDAKDKWRPLALGPSTFDGKHYSVPVDLVYVFFFYNKDLFAQYKVEPPTTWAEFVAACKTFKSSGVIPAAVGNKGKWPGPFYTDYLINRIGGQDAYQRATYDQANGGSFSDPTFVQAWTRLQEAIKAGCFEEGVNGGMETDAGTLLMTGKAAMQLQGTWMPYFYRGVDKDFTDNKLGVLAFPMVEGGVGRAADLMGGTGQAMVISAKAPPEADAALIEMLGSEQFSRDLAGAGLIPSANGTDGLLAGDPLAVEMLKLLASAPSLHLLYGTDLPPKLADSYWNVAQQVFDLVITPEQAAAEMQKVASGLQAK